MSAVNGAPAGSSRAGGQTLLLFASPLNPLILRALARESLRLSDLRQGVGGPAQTTLRAYLCTLIEIGVVAKAKGNAMPYSVSHELTEEGEQLLFVLDVLEAWLATSPQGEIKLGTEPAKSAVKALTDGWDAAILHSLASQPLSLTELDNTISGVSYPALERRLSTMRVTGQAEAVPTPGNATPYTVTEWARRGVAPIIAAVRWERTHLPDETEPVTWVEVEAAFLMALPLLELPEAMSGECVLAVDTKEPEHRIAGVHVVVERGRIVSCETSLRSEPPTFALGSAVAWLEAVIPCDPNRLHAKGDRRLVTGLIEGLHQALFGD
jgi:DNA-binding HxlR family transcriptional regulator